MKSLHHVVKRSAAAAAAAVKICGLSDEVSLHAAIEGGASFIGFVFVPSSKRAIKIDHALALLESLPQPTLCRFMRADQAIAEDGHLVLVALLQNPTDVQVREVLRLKPLLGLLQLHGDETPARVAEIKTLSGLPVMKAIAVATAEDLVCVSSYEKVADMLLFDTKIGKTSGGSGKSFDWSLLKAKRFKKPWMLAGGLTPDNVAEAVKITKAKIVDVSSGVETKTKTGTKKDPDKIRIFLREALG